VTDHSHEQSCQRFQNRGMQVRRRWSHRVGPDCLRCACSTTRFRRQLLQSWADFWRTRTWGSRRCAVATPGYGRNPLQGLCVAAGWCLATRQSHTEVDRPSFQAVAWAVGSAGSISDDGWYRTGSMTLDLVRESHSKADHPHDPKRPSRLCGTAPGPSSHDWLPSPLAFNPRCRFVLKSRVGADQA